MTQTIPNFPQTPAYQTYVAANAVARAVLADHTIDAHIADMVLATEKLAWVAWQAELIAAATTS